MSESQPPNSSKSKPLAPFNNFKLAQIKLLEKARAAG